MKKDIHPRYVEATITCACGEVIQTRSTKREIKVGVCSKCHPFFTGTQKYVDTAGRVEKFMRKYAGAKKPKKVRRRAAAQAPPPAPPAQDTVAPPEGTEPGAQAGGVRREGLSAEGAVTGEGPVPADEPARPGEGEASADSTEPQARAD